MTLDRDTAVRWLDQFEGAGLDGVVAISPRIPTSPASAMIKVKHVRTADCAVAGFRWHKSGKRLGGLAPARALRRPRGAPARRGDVVHHGEAKGAGAGACAPTGEALEGHPWRDWAEADANAMDRKPGAQSRWSAGKRSLGAAPGRAGVRSEVRPPAGRPVPPRRRLPPLWPDKRPRTAATTSSR